MMILLSANCNSDRNGGRNEKEGLLLLMLLMLLASFSP
jgi:hypothetical protein